MKLKSLFTAIVALAVGANFAVAAEEDTPLAKQMSAFNKSLRSLKRQVADPAKKADNLAVLAKMQENMAAARKLEPAKTKDQPAGDKAAYVEKFRGTDVYVGGSFGNAGGVTVNNIAKWDGSRWSQLGTGANGSVTSLAFVGTTLYAAGSFTSIGESSTIVARL